MFNDYLIIPIIKQYINTEIDIKQELWKRYIVFNEKDVDNYIKVQLRKQKINKIQNV